MSYLLFVSYSQFGGALSVQTVYAAMAIMNIYRFPMEIIPLARTSWEEASKSFRRIRDFLILQEVPHAADTDNNCNQVNDDDNPMCEVLTEDSGLLSSVNDSPSRSGEVLVHIQNASFAYGMVDHAKDNNVIADVDTNEPNTSYKSVGAEAIDDSGLEIPAAINLSANPSTSSSSSGLVVLANITLSIRSGELVAVVGSVGSGKTSLLSAMLKQMECVQGSQRLVGDVAYVSQEHWIQNKTLRDNVLFFNSFDEEKYVAAIDASQLSNDLVMLPSADFTAIGERGINLSGGQKARVNIARALYAKDDVDLVVFDDPLAAVDAHVGKAIFEQAILHSLEDKARVVVFSSNYHFLSKFDKIIVVGEQGTGSSLREEGELSAGAGGVGGGCGGHGDEDCKQQNSSIRIFTSHAALVEAYPQYADSSTPATDSTGECPARSNGNSNSDRSDEAPPSQDQDQDRDQDRDCPDSEGEDNTPRGRHVTVPDVLLHDRGSVGERPVFRRSESMYRKMESMILQKQEDGMSADLVENEDREHGSVSVNTITKYYSAAIKGKNGAFTLGVVLLLFSCVQAIRVLGDLWIGVWAKNEASDDPGRSTLFYLVVLTAFLFAIILFTLCRSYYFLYACVGASANLHNSMLESILSASVNKYFDITPIGRILNRFTKDMDAIDSLLPDYLLQSLQSGFHVISIFILCLASTPFFFVAFVPIMVLFYFIQKHFRLTSRELKRLDGVSRSPIYNHLAETLGGLSTIRAYGKQDVFLKIHHLLSNDNKRCFFAFNICNRWLSLRLDTLSAGVVLLVSVLAVLMSNMGSSVDENVLGLAVVYSIQLVDMLQWTARVIIETENNLTSVERLLAFDHIEKESSQQVSSSDRAVPAVWPTEGSVRISDLSLRYRDGLPLVLKRVSLEVPGGCKLGICGRTGSGKR